MKRLLAAALLVLGCQPAKDPTPARQPAQQPAAPSPPGQQAGTQSGPTPPMPQGAGATLSKVDVAIVVGLDQASPALLDKTQDIVARIVATVATTSDGRVAIIAGKKDRKGGAPFVAPAGLASGAFKGIDFDLAPKDALLAAAIAGCGVKESSFPDPHLTTGDGAVVCGKKLLDLAGNTRDSLTHSWLWSLEPVRGTLQAFFRNDTRRVYVFVTNGDAEMFDAAGFKATVGGSPRVVAVVPTSTSGVCDPDTITAKRYTSTAAASGGSSVDICAADGAQAVSAVQAVLKP